MLCIRSGDAAAFDELFNRYSRDVFRIVSRIIDDRAYAEDLTQTIFLKLWLAPEAFRGGSLTAWLSRISRNCALDELRRRKPVVGLPAIDCDGITPHERVCALIDAETLHDAMSDLVEEQRSLIELNYFAGMTHEQISKRTHIPLGTVKTRIRAGLHVLRFVLRRLREFPPPLPAPRVRVRRSSPARFA